MSSVQSYSYNHMLAGLGPWKAEDFHKGRGGRAPADEQRIQVICKLNE